MIYIASDHAGFELKKALASYLDEIGEQYEDIGPHSLNEKDEYPDYIIPAAEKVAEDTANLGIVIGGSGQGEAIAANKVNGIRAALYYGGPEDIIALFKTHNNANVLSLGARFIDAEQMKKAVKLWLETDFSNDERHIRRLNKIKAFEEQGT